MPAVVLLKQSRVIYIGPLVYLRTSHQQPNRSSTLERMNLVVYELMKEAILSREFELDDCIDNGVQPFTDTCIEPDITLLCTGVSDSFDLPPPVPTILQTEHNSHDDELIPPPRLQPTELTLSNELAYVDVHLSNSDED